MISCVAVAVAAVAVGSVDAAFERTKAFSAVVDAPPRVQLAGRAYVLRVLVKNRGAAIRPFCVDFTDDDNSWVIAMPGLSSWNSDTFCLALPGYRRKVLTARLIPARPGARKLEILIGKAEIFRSSRRALVTDDNALGWEQQFVIVG